MINNLLLTGNPPVCRCVLCQHSRAARLTQALQKKYSPAQEFIK
jgi:hypothetical protein